MEYNFKFEFVGISILVRYWHCKNADLPICTTLVGIIIFCIEEQQKDSSLIVFNCEYGENITFFNFLLKLNAFIPILVTFCGIKIFSIDELERESSQIDSNLEFDEN